MKEIPLEQAFAFAEWAATNRIRLSSHWVHTYANQTDRSNWKTTAQLWDEYIAVVHPQVGRVRVLLLIPHTPEMRKFNNPALIARMTDGNYYRCEYSFDPPKAMFQPSHTRLAQPAEYAGLEDAQPLTAAQVRAYFELYVPEDTTGSAGLE